MKSGPVRTSQQELKRDFHSLPEGRFLYVTELSATLCGLGILGQCHQERSPRHIPDWGRDPFPHPASELKGGRCPDPKCVSLWATRVGSLCLLSEPMSTYCVRASFSVPASKWSAATSDPAVH